MVGFSEEYSNPPTSSNHSLCYSAIWFFYFQLLQGFCEIFFFKRGKAILFLQEKKPKFSKLVLAKTYFEFFLFFTSLFPIKKNQSKPTNFNQLIRKRIVKLCFFNTLLSRPPSLPLLTLLINPNIFVYEFNKMFTHLHLLLLHILSCFFFYGQTHTAEKASK